MAMKENEFYSVKLKKKIMIPAKDIVTKIRNGRKFAVGTYKVGNDKITAWKVLGMACTKKKKK